LENQQFFMAMVRPALCRTPVRLSRPKLYGQPIWAWKHPDALDNANALRIAGCEPFFTDKLFAATGLVIIFLDHGSSQYGAMLMAIALPMTFLAQALREAPL
jgi:hypothetical protein